MLSLAAIDMDVGETERSKLQQVFESQAGTGAVVAQDCAPNCHDVSKATCRDASAGDGADWVITSSAVLRGATIDSGPANTVPAVEIAGDWPGSILGKVFAGIEILQRTPVAQVRTTSILSGARDTAESCRLLAAAIRGNALSK